MTDRPYAMQEMQKSPFATHLADWIQSRRHLDRGQLLEALIETFPGMTGHVFRRTGAARTPIELLDSGVIIPE
jgi:hypothetical protein